MSQARKENGWCAVSHLHVPFATPHNDPCIRWRVTYTLHPCHANSLQAGKMKGVCSADVTQPEDQSKKGEQEQKAILSSLQFYCMLRPWQTRTCCGHVVHDVSWAAQTGKHFLQTQHVSEQNQKQFLCPRHKICVRDKCYARGQTGKHLC